MAEYFSDVVCLKDVFDFRISDYLRAWSDYYVNWLEAEYLRGFLATLSGEPFVMVDSPGADSQPLVAEGNMRELLEVLERGATTKAHVYVQRLLVAAMCYCVKHGEADTDAGQVREAAELLQDHAATQLDGDNMVAGILALSISTYVDALASVNWDEPPARPELGGALVQNPAMFLRNLPAAARKIEEFLVAVSKPSAWSDGDREEVEMAKQAISSGQVVPKPVRCAIGLIPHLHNASFAGAMAMAFSLTHWYESEYNDLQKDDSPSTEVSEDKHD